MLALLESYILIRAAKARGIHCGCALRRAGGIRLAREYAATN